MQALEAIQDSCFKDGKREQKGQLLLVKELGGLGGWRWGYDMEEKWVGHLWSFVWCRLSLRGPGLPAESQIILRPRGWLGNSLKAWNLAPQDTNSYGNTSCTLFYISLFVRKKERPRTWNASHFGGPRLGIVSQFDKDFLWESGKRKAFL